MIEYPAGRAADTRNAHVAPCEESERHEIIIMLESRCGKLCGECAEREEFGCAGCRETPLGEEYWGEECEIKECCQDKEHEHCGLCKEFPCQRLVDISYDPDTGDGGERLVNCKSRADGISDVKIKSLRRFLTCVSIGIAAGTLIGAIQNNFAAWVAAGALTGAAVGLMTYFYYNDKT